MGALAHELGWSRATLYRKTPPREELLGEVVWFLTRHALVDAIEASKRLKGPSRVATTAERFLRFVGDQPAFRRFLEQEPEVALRVLTSKHGPVQAGMTSATEALLNEEARRGNLKLLEDARTLAYAIVRIGEGFLYADLIADEATDPERAGRVIALLLEPLRP
jgi:tetracycline repressor-like protein